MRANPSLSQMSGHTASVTASPNHWCETSCTTVEAPGAPLELPSTSYIDFVCDSSA